MNKMDISTGNLLLEFFSEEIPARMQLNSETHLRNLFLKSLAHRDIAFESLKTYSGPRHLSIIIKNIIGYVLIVGGILMLVLPGQGLFTIVIGLMLSNYPGKFFIEKKFIAIPSILKTINWLRRKSDQPPLKI